jgi:hypothetical protein
VAQKKPGVVIFGEAPIGGELAMGIVEDDQ